MTLAWWTSLSDKYGRVFLMKFAIATSIFSSIVHLYAAAPHHSIGTGLLFADGIFRGLTATGHLYNPAVFAYCGMFERILVERQKKKDGND